MNHLHEGITKATTDSIQKIVLENDMMMPIKTISGMQEFIHSMQILKSTQSASVTSSTMFQHIPLVT